MKTKPDERGIIDHGGNVMLKISQWPSAHELAEGQDKLGLPRVLGTRYTLVGSRRTLLDFVLEDVINR